jgi:hypothetical protein
VVKGFEEKHRAHDEQQVAADAYGGVDMFVILDEGANYDEIPSVFFMGDDNPIVLTYSCGGTLSRALWRRRLLCQSSRPKVSSPTSGKDFKSTLLNGDPLAATAFHSAQPRSRLPT